MGLRIYEHRCKNEDCPVDRFDSDEKTDAVCPDCGKVGIRIFGATTAYHPSKSPSILRLKSGPGKPKRGWS